jgi:hypothetical protein
MGYRYLGGSAAAIAVMATLVAQPAAQAPATGVSPSTLPASRAANASKPYMPPRTPDGQPDLQGTWTNATYTPLERPAELAGKEFWAPEEAAAYERARVLQFNSQTSEDIHYDNVIWQTEPYSKGVSGLRTSLITDPRDGHIPPLTPEGRRRAEERAARRGNPADAIQNRTIAERCITWGNDVPPLIPAGYNANLQIVQGAGYVVVITEMIHTARIIPLDGRAHLGANLQQLIGDSRGHWEGNTLVVDTTNFTDRTAFRGSGDKLHVTERFTRTGADSIRYEFTVEDPTTWTRPWSAEIPIRRMDAPIYEYACAEGNYGIANILRAARVQDEKAKAAVISDKIGTE